MRYEKNDSPQFCLWRSAYVNHLTYRDLDTNPEGTICCMNLDVCVSQCVERNFVDNTLLQEKISQYAHFYIAKS